MKKTSIIVVGLLMVSNLLLPAGANSQQTFCNPLNISYRFFLEPPSRREAADPAIVLYKDNYYLFASKLAGYYYSLELLNGNFVTTTDLPIENYAPVRKSK